jgi:hypothetical protein
MGKPFAERKCAYCAHTKGTIAYRFYRNGIAERDYFHPGCFSQFLSELEAYHERPIA